MKLFNFVITIITIEAGWKVSALRALNSKKPGRHSMTVDGPSDMVNRIIEKAKSEGDVVDRLNIIGHGNPKGMQIGAHFVELSNVKNYEADFIRLRQALSSEGFIHLQGCEVGQNEKLVKELARMFATPVYAGTSADNVMLDFNFGSYIKVYPSGRVEEKTWRPA